MQLIVKKIPRIFIEAQGGGQELPSVEDFKREFAA